jgi:hypothetical protein
VTVITDDHHQWNIAPVFLSRVLDANTAEAAHNAPNIVRLPTKP